MNQDFIGNNQGYFMWQVVALVSTVVALVRSTPGVRCTWMGYHLQVQRTPGVHRTEPGGISIHDRQNRQVSLRDHRILQHEIALGNNGVW
jgi:hypothetical protein